MILKIESIENINCHSQQDFFQILMLILGQLFQQNKHLQNLFVMQIENTCQCGTFITSNMLLTNQQQTCQSCQRTIKVTLQKENHLMIISNNNQKYNSVKPYKIYINGGLFYKCIAKIFYIGNSKVGHYRASRLCSEQQFIEFSDSRVYPEQSKNPIYLLYRRQAVSVRENEVELKKEMTELTLSIMNFNQLNEITEDTQASINQQYYSKVKLVYKVTASNIYENQRIVYFDFRQTQNQGWFTIQLNILNKDNFILEMPIIRKKYKDKNLRTKFLCISVFLNEFQQKMNKKIYKFYKQTKKHQEKAFFSQSNYKYSLQQNDQSQNLSYTKVIRNYDSK